MEVNGTMTGKGILVPGCLGELIKPTLEFVIASFKFANL